VQRLREKDRLYRLNNPEGARTRKQRRRARELSLPNTLTRQDWRRALRYFEVLVPLVVGLPGLFHRLAMDQCSLHLPGQSGESKESSDPLPADETVLATYHKRHKHLQSNGEHAASLAESVYWAS